MFICQLILRIKYNCLIISYMRGYALNFRLFGLKTLLLLICLYNFEFLNCMFRKRRIFYMKKPL